MITELEPAFAVTFRGFDRVQVDEYVDTLREWLGNATIRMEEAESDSSHLREQVLLLRTRLAQLERQLTDGPPKTIAALGDRVNQILQLAEEAATAVQADAEAEAVAILGRARQEAQDLVLDAQGRQAQAEALMAGTRDQVSSVLRAAEAQGAEAARRLIEDAETQRAAIMAQLEQERIAVTMEVQRLACERDEVRDGLTRLRESLHRTISELADAAPPSSGRASAGRPLEGAYR